MWSGFHAAVSDRLAAASIPFAPTPGNHDASGHASFAAERAIFVDEWSARRPAVSFLDDAFAPGRESETLADAATEQLFVEHGVTAYISGHHHAFYPGRRGALRVVSMACLGSGPRTLIGDDTISPRSLLLLELGADGVRTLEGMGGASFDVPIDRATLPASIGSGATLVTRDDL